MTLHPFRIGFFIALFISLAIHLAFLGPWRLITPRPAPPRDLQVSLAPEPVKSEKPAIRPPVKVKEKVVRVPDASPLTPAPEKPPRSMAPPPAPSAGDWALASTYKLKNSKRYRNAWGQQVRSLMGTAVEGPDQGQVRFRIEIAPDGSITRIEELWSTSAAASKLAWQAIRSLPPLPPTPTGKPLVFEQTISFLPYETGWPPSYKLDCLPDPPTFQNPFAWDGASAPTARPVGEAPAGNGAPSTDCVTDSTADSIEEEERELKRQMEQNRWGR